jgi:hypothetical protein
MVRGLLLAVASIVALGVAPVAADEVKVPVSASMFLSTMTAPIEAREAAFDRSLKEAGGPAPRPSLMQVLPDGSVKVDRAVITVRNPCPPGEIHYEPPPLPGRRARN